MQLIAEYKKRVETILVDKGWTLSDLAENSALSVATVKRFSSQQKVGDRSFIKLCDTLGIDSGLASGLENSEAPIEREQRPVNPFMKRGMLDRLEDIYGRDREIQQIFEFLNSGTSVALIGVSGMGTSSLLKAVELLADERLNQKRIPIYLNMREVNNAEEYYQTLAAEIGIKYETEFQLKRALKDKRLLLLLDSTEQLTQEWFTEGMRRQLRAWANQGASSPIRLVVAAHQPLTELFEDNGLDSPFPNICHELELKPWNRDTIQGFINEKLKGTGVKFTPEDIEEISIGIPRKVMESCYQLYEQ